MRNLYLLLFIGLTTICWAQPPQITIHFDDTTYQNYVTIDTSSAKVWHVGKPQKTFFDSAYNTPNVIITDTSSSYPTNDTSSFILTIKNALGSSAGYNLKLRYKIDTEKNKDGVLVLAKCDGGNWINLLDQNNFNPCNFFYLPRVFSNAANIDTLENGNYALTGTDNSWNELDIDFLCMAVRIGNKAYPDIDIKFLLSSDSNQTNQEGLMIDDIRFYDNGGICSSIEEFNQAETLNIFPNPTYDISYLDLSNLIKAKTLRVSIINLLGEEIQSSYTSEALTKLSFKDFTSGIYQIMVFEEDKILGKSKVIKY